MTPSTTSKGPSCMVVICMWFIPSRTYLNHTQVQQMKPNILQYLCFGSLYIYSIHATGGYIYTNRNPQKFSNSRPSHGSVMGAIAMMEIFSPNSCSQNSNVDRISKIIPVCDTQRFLMCMEYIWNIFLLSYHKFKPVMQVEIPYIRSAHTPDIWGVSRSCLKFFFGVFQ